MGHQENSLLESISDEQLPIREISVIQRTREERSRKTNQTSVLQFKVPTLNFIAKKTLEFIDWSNSLRTEPSLPMQLSDEQLEEAKEHHI